MSRRDPGDYVSSSVAYSAKRPNAQTIPLPQSIHEIRCELSVANGLAKLMKKTSNSREYEVYKNHQPSEMDMGAIGHHMILICKRGGTEGNKVFGCLNKLTLNPTVATAYESALSAGKNAEERRQLIRDSIQFMGILQSEIMHSSLSLKHGISRRDHGSAVIGGIFAVQNPYKKAIPILSILVLDVPNPDNPEEDIVMNKQFGYNAVRPFFRAFDPTKPNDPKFIVGRLVSDFNPIDGPIMRIQLSCG